ncbi:hypothetical protein [Kribbella deserti]|uniref:Secreted protein n=1 Tax=Kribbella deserti TaxID=1926257 RepID=A0ABV6QVS6_9ACTN
MRLARLAVAAMLGVALAPVPPAVAAVVGDVAVSEYDLGDEAVYLPGITGKAELRARVYRPTGFAGRRPLVIFLHGWHSNCYEPKAPAGADAGERVPNASITPNPKVEARRKAEAGLKAGDEPRYWPCPPDSLPLPSYRGYDAPARELASHGYQVVSISANGVNAQDGVSDDAGAQARGELVMAHLDLWRRWSTSGGGPYGKAFVGKVDLGRVGLMGHSRGGEGVVRAGLINLRRGSPYGIKAVQPLAPVNFVRSVIPGVAMNVILPYCDGDASNLQGQHYYDDAASFQDGVSRSTALLMGANHNYFNTEWTPGQSTAPGHGFDDWEGKKEPCGANSSGRLKPLQQQALGAKYISGFFRLELGKEKELLPLFDGSGDVVTARAADRKDLQQSGVTGNLTATSCAGMTCVASDKPDRFPHFAPASLARTTPLPAFTKLGWTGKDGTIRYDVRGDVRRYGVLTFRAAPGVGAGDTDLTVAVVDAQGRTATVPVSTVSKALNQLPGDGEAEVPRTVLRSVQVPLASLKGIDLSNVREVQVRADRVDSGSAFLADMAFARPDVSDARPVNLPGIRVNDLPSMQEGDSGEKTAAFTVSLSRPSSQEVTVDAETFWRDDDRQTIVKSVVRRVTFKPGQTSQRVELAVQGNTRDGWDGRYHLVLTGARHALVDKPLGTGLVIDDDPEPVFTIGTTGEGTEGGTVRFPLRLSAPSDKTWWFEGEFVDGTATLGDDFRSSMAPPDYHNPKYPMDQGEIPPGETTGWLAVPAVADGIHEPDETFQLKVLSTSGATPELPLTLTGTIHNH